MSPVTSSRRFATAAMLAVFLAPSIAQAQTTLRVPMVSRTIFYLPAWTAEKQGFFKQEGLDVKLEVYDGSDKIFHDLRAGTHQIGIASIESVIAKSYKGGKLKIVAGIAKRPPHFIIAQPEIKTLADLKGKTIGVVSMHEGTTFFIADIAKAGGFKLEDVKVEAVGGSPTRQRLLKERKIDMGLQPYPLSYEAEAAGFSNLGAMAKLVPDYQFVSVMADEGWARANRPALVGFLRAMRRGTDYMFAHPANRPSSAPRSCAPARPSRAARSRTPRAWTSCRAICRWRMRACGGCSASCSRPARSPARRRSSRLASSTRAIWPRAGAKSSAPPSSRSRSRWRCRDARAC